MPHRLRKTRKHRGSRTQGWGRVGQHRKSGCKGHRKVGRHKHLWSYVTTHEPNYFGKKGFTSIKSLKRREYVLNVGMLDELAKKKSTKRQNKLFLDLEQLGYTKLLGAGRVTQPLVVKVPNYSKFAAEKIEGAGGQISTESRKTE